MNTRLRALGPATGGLALLLSAGVANGDTTIDPGNVGGQVWTADKSPYHVRGTPGDLTVAVGEELRMEAGTVVRFSNPNGGGALDVRGSLKVNGTADAPVILEGEPGSIGKAWYGITGGPTPGATIEIDHAVIRDGGFCLWLRLATARVTRTTFERCTVGITIEDGTYTFDALTLRNNTVALDLQGDSNLESLSVSLTNALIQGNSMGLRTISASFTVVNATIDGNGTGVYGAVRSTPTVLDIQNSIFSNSKTAAVLIVTSSDHPGPVTMTATHSTFWNNARDVSGNGAAGAAGTMVPAGQGNVAADPKYVDATDPHLTAGSPCVDSGNAARAPDHDLDGNPRPFGAMVDRGAFELVLSGGNGGSAGTMGPGGSGGAAGGATGGASGGNGGMGAGGGGGAPAGGTSGAGHAGTGGGMAGDRGANSGGNSDAGGSGDRGGAPVVGGVAGSQGETNVPPSAHGCGCVAGGAPPGGSLAAAVIPLALALALRSRRRKSAGAARGRRRQN